MFIAKVIKSKSGKWFGAPLDFIEDFNLGPKSGIQHGYITIDDPSVYSEFKNRFQQLFESETDGYAVFSNSELQKSESFLLHNFSPDMTYPARLSKDDDGFEYLRYAFGEICQKFGTPLKEQINPITLSQEFKLSKKYIWGGFNGVSGYIFTDFERYTVLNQKWGLQKKEVLIGAKQKISKTLVQIEIPISEIKLCFGNSIFGKTSKLDGSGDELSDTFSVCPFCGTPLYTTQILDFFPSFEENINKDIVFTKEWFGWYRKLVVSRKFVDWLIENKYLSWNSNFLIPVKDFCKK